MRFVGTTLGLLLLAACAAPARRHPLPPDLMEAAEIEGVENARHFADEPPEYWERLIRRNVAKMKAAGLDLADVEHHYLAVSGGGANGAYGAGLLCGWTEAGTRPTFTIVTGISTGAFTAPLAFLGSRYDATLEEIYTTVRTKDLVRKRPLLSILFGDAAADTDGLRKKLHHYFTDALIDEIGTEHRKGRRLYIGTTNLDAQRAVIWNIGAIAICSRPDRYDLVRTILLASASIPGAFPPTIIDVTADGKPYDEMHVDGGVTEQVFLYPASDNWRELLEELNYTGTPKAYVVRNARIRPDYTITRRKLFPIASQTIASLLRTQGVGDLYRIFDLCQRDGIDFHLSTIPDAFDRKPKEPFDPEYMRALFEVGRNAAREGRAWSRFPPHYVPRK